MTIRGLYIISGEGFVHASFVPFFILVYCLDCSVDNVVVAKLVGAMPTNSIGERF